MTDDLSRRDWMKIVGAAGAGSVLASESAARPRPARRPGRDAPAGAARAEILPLTLDERSLRPAARPRLQQVQLRLSRTVRRVRRLCDSRSSCSAATTRTRWIRAGWRRPSRRRACASPARASRGPAARRSANGTLVAQLRKTADGVEIDVTATMDQPIKTVTAIVRGVPRGKLSSSGGDFADTRDNEILLGYPFGGGDLFNCAGGLTTPVAVIQSADDSYMTFSSLDDKVRTKRIYLQPGEHGYKVELDARSRRMARPEDAARSHVAHLAHEDRRGRVRRALRAPPHGVSLPRLRDAPRRARVAARHRARAHAARPALHGLHLQRLREDARDPALGEHADPGQARARVHLLVGRPLLLGLSQLQGERPHGRRRRIPRARDGRAEDGLPDHADVRHEHARTRSSRAGRASPTPSRTRWTATKSTSTGSTGTTTATRRGGWAT